MQFSTIVLTLVSSTAIVSGLAIPNGKEVSAAGKQLIARFQTRPHSFNPNLFGKFKPDWNNLGNPFVNDPKDQSGDPTADARWGSDRAGHPNLD